MSKKPKKDEIWEPTPDNINLTERKEKVESAESRAGRIEKRVSQRDKLWIELQEHVDKMSACFRLLMAHDLETYQLLNKPDALYGDSPISPAYSKTWVKQYLIKQDMDFLGGIFFDGKPAIKTLVERGIESSKWVMRFTQEPPDKKSGLQEIVEG